MKTIDIFKTNIEIDKLYHKLEEEDKKIFSNIMDAFDNCVVENDKKDKEIERLNNIIKEAYDLADVLYSNYYSSAGKDMSEIFESLLDMLYKEIRENK